MLRKAKAERRTFRVGGVLAKSTPAYCIKLSARENTLLQLSDIEDGDFLICTLKTKQVFPELKDRERVTFVFSDYTSPNRIKLELAEQSPDGPICVLERVHVEGGWPEYQRGVLIYSALSKILRSFGGSCWFGIEKTRNGVPLKRRESYDRA